MRTHTHTHMCTIHSTTLFHSIPCRSIPDMTCHDMSWDYETGHSCIIYCCTMLYSTLPVGLHCTTVHHRNRYIHTHKQKQVNKEAHALWACFELLWAHTWLQSDTEFKQKQAWSFGFHIMRMRPCLFIPPDSERVSTYAREWTISYEIIDPSPWVTTGTDVRYCLKSKNVQGIDCILWVLEACFRGHI